MLSIKKMVFDFLDGISDSVIEDRVVDYVLEEIQKDRRLVDILNDPYIRNRINEDQRKRIVENPEIVDAVDNEVRATFERIDKEL